MAAKKKATNTGAADNPLNIGNSTADKQKPARKRPAKKNAQPDEQASGDARTLDFLTVGIGASAGGLEALEEFFKNLPSDSGMAFVVVTHQPPDHKSLLPELLGRCTSMSVVKAANRTKLKPNHVYVGPPGNNVSVEGGEVSLTESTAPVPTRLPIDSFLRSLAADQRERAVCIVLSGTGTDGTLGLKAIKGEAGMAIVQEPQSARYDGMPRSAIGTGQADYVLPPAEMPAQLLAYASGPYLTAGTRTREVSPIPDEPLQQIFAQLRSRTGHDFSSYKLSTIKRRIERRMNVHQLRRPDEYVRYLHENPQELDSLFKELLIGVTSFFRDGEAFESFATGPLTDLIKARSENSTFRGWIPGCATGEEVFSIAILVRECLDRLGKHLEVQLFGTDLDADAIETARLGQYPMGIAADVAPERLDRFFRHNDHVYSVSKEIRAMTVFATQNVIKDPPFTKLDLISCRNLLIYLNGDMQHRLLRLFHYALKSGGLLWLGPSETIGSGTDLFETVDKRWKIFRRLESGAARQRLPEIPAGPRIIEPRTGEAPAPLERPQEPHIGRLLERMLLARFAPACVIVNEHGDIIFIHGRTGAYLEPAPGLTRANILEMARQGLEFELRAALRQAARQDDEVLCEGVLVKSNGEHITVNVSVAKIREPEAVRGLLLVTFRPQSGAESSTETSRRRSKRRRAGSSTGSSNREAQLERELQHARESLRWTVEELEVSNEELRASNEELQSTNEELQSTNEELETSREELQSLNEELTTVNSELELKVDALSRSSDDMQNLLNNTNIATIFLDRDLHIRRFTEHAKKLVKLIDTDVGRPLGDLTIDLQYDGLLDDCRSVLRNLDNLEREVQSKRGTWYLMRILPYRTTENVVTGLVITFVNIHHLKSVEATAFRAEESAEFFESIVQTIRQPLLVLGADLSVIAANDSFHQMFETQSEEVVGRRIYDLGEHQWDIPRLRELLEEILPHSASFNDFRVEHVFPKVGHKVLLLSGRRLERKPDMLELIFLSIEEVSEA